MSTCLLILILALLQVGCIEGGGGSTSSLVGNSEGSVTLAGTPEPSTLALFGIGLGGLLMALFRKKRRN